MLTRPFLNIIIIKESYQSQLVTGKMEIEMNEKIHKSTELILPVLAVRGLVVFPDMSLQFDVGRKKSVAAVKEALKVNRTVFLGTQTDLSDDEPTGDDLYKIGVVARIKQVLQDDDEGIRVNVEGLYRAEIKSVTDEEPCIKGLITPCIIPGYREGLKTEALIRLVQEHYEEYIRWFKHAPRDVVLRVLNEKDCGMLTDYICANINLDYVKKQYILEELHPVKRLTKLNEILSDEIQILKVESDITRKAQQNIDANQREYILREQMKVIASELGEDDSPQDEADELREKIESLKADEVVKDKLLHECERLYRMPFGSHEASVSRLYLETCLELPWNEKTNEKIDISKAEKILNRDHYGMEKVKERFLEILAVKK